MVGPDSAAHGALTPPPEARRVLDFWAAAALAVQVAGYPGARGSAPESGGRTPEPGRAKVSAAA
jgi:hypothetical protein